MENKTNLIELINSSKNVEEFVNSLDIKNTLKYYTFGKMWDESMQKKLKDHAFIIATNKHSEEITFGNITKIATLSKGETTPGKEPVIKINESKLIEWAKAHNINLPYKLDTEAIESQEWYLANQNEFCDILPPKEIKTYDKILIKDKK